MLPGNWPNAIAHVDADCFFASCEQLRRPDLKGRPVCVLSSQDACVVAKTYDAKAAGITTGMPVWDARKLLPEANYLSADFRYYGQISDKLFAILRRYSPVVEAYSIDEGFMDLNGLRSLYRKPYQAIADEIRNTIHHEVGVTVSVGISVTRTLAKMASEYNKPDGTTIVAGRRIHDFLRQVGVRDIPGIGGNRQALLNKFDIHTAADFVDMPEREIKRLLGKAGTDLWHELNGTPVYKIETEAGIPKSVARTASMGEVTQDKTTIHAHLLNHAMRLSRELITKRLTARQLTVFLTLKSFDKQAGTFELPYPSADYFLLAREAGEALDTLYDPDRFYRACGLIASGIGIRQSGDFDLFQMAEQQEEEKHLKLLETMHAINHKHGDNVLSICGAMQKRRAGGKMGRFAYPVLECG
ncbi:MAG: DNA polymerase IV [Nitrosomonadales bacterium]|nr:DNA polymerase IV [Nitrosomonadales bacterium]